MAWAQIASPSPVLATSSAPSSSPFTQGAKVSAVTDDVHAVLCRHEGHLDNSGGEGSSFGALLSDKSFLELMSNDETAGIRPADGGQDSLSSHRLWAALLTYPVSAQARS